jgi:hypothetical protein
VAEMLARDMQLACDYIEQQNGSTVHDLYVHTRDPHQFYRTLDCVPRLCLRTFSSAERTIYRVDLNVISALGALDQHLHPDRESATALSSGGKLQHQLTAVTTNSLVNFYAD